MRQDFETRLEVVKAERILKTTNLYIYDDGGCIRSTYFHLMSSYVYTQLSLECNQ